MLPASVDLTPSANIHGRSPHEHTSSARPAAVITARVSRPSGAHGHAAPTLSCFCVNHGRCCSRPVCGPVLVASSRLAPLNPGAVGGAICDPAPRVSVRPMAAEFFTFSECGERHPVGGARPPRTERPFDGPLPSPPFQRRSAGKTSMLFAGHRFRRRPSVDEHPERATSAKRPPRSSLQVGHAIAERLDDMLRIRAPRT